MPLVFTSVFNTGFAQEPNVRVRYGGTQEAIAGDFHSIEYCGGSLGVLFEYQWSGTSPTAYKAEVVGVAPNTTDYSMFGNVLSIATASGISHIYNIAIKKYGVLVREFNLEVKLTSVAIPSVLPIPGNAICEGESITLSSSAQSGVMYTWLRNYVKIKEDDVSNFIEETLPKGTYTYSLDISKDECYETSGPIVVTVNENPTVMVAPLVEVCPTNDILLKSNPSNGTSPYAFNWTTSALNSIDPAVVNNQNITINNAEEDNEGQYTVTVTDANGCKAVGVSDVTVHPIINPGAISGTQRICEGFAPKELKSTAPASGGDGTIAYLWVQSTDGGSTWHDADGTNDELTYTPPSDLSITTQYKRTVTNSCGSAETLPVTVTVDKKVVLSLGGPYSTCPEVDIQLNGGISGGVTTGMWSVEPSLGSFDDPTKMNAKFTPASGIKNTDIELTLVSDKPAAPSVCKAVSEVVVVKVHDYGKATYSFPTTVCNSVAEFPLDITPAGGNYTPNTYNDVTNFKPSDFNNGDTYTFKYNGVLDANGCAIDEDITISITSPQVFNITTLSPATYCVSGDGVSINLDGSENGVTYTVYKDGVATTHKTTGTGSPISIHGVKDGDGDYTVKATDANGCWIDMNGKVTLIEVSDVGNNTITADQTICEGSPATPFTGSAPSGGDGTYTYQWQKSENGGPWTDIPSSDVKDYDPGNVSATTKYRRIVTSGNACQPSISNEVTITTTTPIDYNIISGDQSICYNTDPAEFTGTVATGTGGTITYTWHETPDGTTLGAQVGTGQNLDLSTPLTTTTKYIRKASNGACPDHLSNFITVTVAAELKVNIINPKKPSCGGGDDGELEADASGGLGDYTYTWTGDKTGTGKTFTGLKAGSYTVTVTASGCDASTTATDSYTLGEPTLVTGTPTPKDVTLCFGNSNGEISVTAGGGTGPYTFTLGADVQNGTSANFTGLVAGDYTINIEDSKGCPGTATATINQPNELLMGTPDLVKPSCVGNADGQITVNASGGTGALTYTLNGGTPTPVGTPTTGLPADIYNIVVTDVNGCSITGSETLADPVPVSLNPMPIPVAGCPGSATGGIALSITGGTGPYEYYSDQLGSTWTPLTSNEINGLAAGNYTVKVRDANLCESLEQTVTVTELNALNFTATPNTVDCHNSTNGEIVISGIAGGTGSNYQLFIDDNGVGVHDGTVPYDVTSGTTTYKFDKLAPATYTITLSDGVCNSLPKDVTIDAPPAITLTLDEVGKVYCYTPFAAAIMFTADGGSGNLTYHITGAYPPLSNLVKTKGFSQKVEDLEPGNYTIIVEDEKGCKSAPKDFTIDPADILIVGKPLAKSMPKCSGENTGVVEVSISGGAGPFRYRLCLQRTPGVIIQEHEHVVERTCTFTGIGKGVYVVKVYDEGNIQSCEPQSGIVEVEDPDPIEMVEESFKDNSCHGSNDAELIIKAKGGTGDLTVTLYKDGIVHGSPYTTQPGASITIPVADEGEYYAEVTDENSCGPITTSTYTVTNPAEVVFAVAVQKNLDCADDASGSITINGIGGGSGTGYAYSIDGGTTYVDIADPTGDVPIPNLSAGDYEVLVRDGNRCPAATSVPVSLTQPEPLLLSLAFTNPGCSTVGEIVATASGGIAPYEFSFDDGATWSTTNTLPNVSTGHFTVMLKDANGCDATESIDVETPTDVVIVSDLQVINQPSCEELGRLHIEAEGGTQPLNYQLYLNGSSVTVPRDENGIFTVKDDGDYHVVVTDANGCFGKTSTTVSINPYPGVRIDPALSITDVLCGGKATGAVTGVAAGGMTGEIFYILKNDPLGYSQSNTTGTFTDLHASDYYYLVANDGATCADTLAFAIAAPDTLKLNVVDFDHETSLGASDGRIEVMATGGVPGYTYTLKTSGYVVATNTTGLFENLGSGTYEVEVEDAIHCITPVTVVLQGVSASHDYNNVSCYGGNDGEIDVFIEGNPPYTIKVIGLNTGIRYTIDDFTYREPLTGIDTLKLSGLVADVWNITIGDKFSGAFLQAPIFEADPLVVSPAGQTDPICATGGYGRVEFNVSGNVIYDSYQNKEFKPIYVVKWENLTTGQSGQQEATTAGIVAVPNLDPGEYKFTVTTEHGCQPQEFDIFFPEISPIVVTTNVLQESSYGAGNGLIEANATGDNPIVTYHLLDKDGNLVATSAIGLFSNVSEGKYVVMAEDDLTCPGYSDTIYIRGTDVVVDDITPVTCFGENQGAFKFHIEHGFPRFKSVSVADASGNTVAIAPEMVLYSCNEPITAENLLAGDYTITIEDSLNNTIKHTVTIGQPDKLIIDATLTAPDCASNGSIALTVVGGVAPYTMEWAIDEGALEPLSSSTIDIVQGGTYRVVVTDANNCSTEWSQFVAPAESITLALEEVSNPTCFGGDNGRIAVEAANDGSSMYQYLLEKDGTLINITDNGVFENLSKGDYKVVVQNINTGCSQSFSYTLVDGAEAINIAFDGFTGKLNCPSDADGYATAVVTGGSGSYTYVWPQLGETTSSVSGLTPGTYEVIVADDLGCTATASYTIDGPKPFVFDKATRTEAKCRNSAIPANLGGKLSVGLVEGGTAPYSFYLVDETNHSIREGQPNFTGLGAGIYEVWVEDANGCRDMYYDTVLISPINDFEIGAMDTTVCFTNEVELKANVILGDVYSGQPLKYSWWSEANAANVSPDATGETYPLEGLDVNVYRYKLRVSQEGGDRCYVEKWFDVGVYPKIDIHVPLYVSSVQNDTILSILFNQEYNVDVSTSTFDYNTSFEWKPSGVFTRGNSWNSSIFMTPEKYEELKQTYPHRFKTLRDPQTKRDGDFFLVDVVATTDVGCQDSLTLYTKIVNKLYLANVFSPNGDGRNDIWKLPKEYLFPDLEIEIFNRWGALVWSAAGDKAARGWDGRTNNGKVLPIGTYWYVIKFNINSSEWKPLTGSVTIVK